MLLKYFEALYLRDWFTKSQSVLQCLLYMCACVFSSMERLQNHISRIRPSVKLNEYAWSVIKGREGSGERLLLGKMEAQRRECMCPGCFVEVTVSREHELVG